MTSLTAAVDARPRPTVTTATDADFRRGAGAMLPLLAGYAPFACLLGVAVASSIQPAAAWSGVWLIFAGTAHLTAVRLVDSGAGVFAAVVTALSVNARLLLFSATLAPYWRGTRISSRLVAAATVIDPTWLLAAPNFARSPDAASGRRFYYGASAVLWLAWPAMVTLGLLVGAAVPREAGLDLLAPLCLMAMLTAAARTRRGAASIAGAAVAATACADLPAALTLLVPVAAGVVVAAVVTAVHDRRNRS
jgi:predicted branched-subunit amino acid permease